MQENTKRVKLLVAPCSYEAAKYAVMHWHYSRTMPVGKRVNIGVWEKGQFIGVIIFGTGACPQIADPFKIARQEACELVRVALRKHQTNVSRIISIGIHILRKICPNLRIIVSYADPEQGHNGGIYQAGNWLYLGETVPVEWFIYTKTNKRVHTKTVKTGRRGYATKLKKQGIIRSIYLIKYKYAYPLDKKMRKQIEKSRQDNPKRATSIGRDALDYQSGDGGASPTVALNKKRIA